MNKKLFALILAGLLVASMAACRNNPGDTEDPTNAPSDTNDNYIVVGTDEQGNDITEIPTEQTPEDPGMDPSETNPTFTEAIGTWSQALISGEYTAEEVINEIAAAME